MWNLISKTKKQTVEVKKTAKNEKLMGEQIKKGG